MGAGAEAKPKVFPTPTPKRLRTVGTYRGVRAKSEPREKTETIRRLATSDHFRLHRPEMTGRGRGLLAARAKWNGNVRAIDDV